MFGAETPESIVEPYLLQGERILWSGRPSQGLRLAAPDGFLIPFSLFWGGFAIFWNFGVWSIPGPGPIAFKLFGLPFLVVGLYLIAGRFVLDAWVRQRTVYALTDRRAIVVKRLFSEQMLTASIDHSVRLSRRSGGSGDLEFGFRQTSPFSGSQSWSMWTPALESRVRFLGIPDAVVVYQLAQAKRD